MRVSVQQQRPSRRLSNEHFLLIVLSVMAGVAAAATSFFAIQLHQAFIIPAIDTAVLQSAIVNTIHGHWLAANDGHGPSILGAHTTFLLLLFVPLYVLWPSLDLLFTVQVVGIYSTVIPIYFVAASLLRRPLLAFCVAVTALLSPMLFDLAVAPLHLETWIVAAVFWSYFFYLRNNLPGFIGSWLFACCCGEQAALIYISLGLALLLAADGCEWRRRFGWWSLGGGIGWLVFALFIAEPLNRTHGSFDIFSYNYSQWDIRSPAGLPSAVAKQPLLALEYLFSANRWGRLALLVGLPLGMAFLSLRSALLLCPWPIYFLMSDQEFYLYFHAYYFGFVFIAGQLGLIYFLARRRSNRLRLILLSANFLLSSILLLATVGFYYVLTAVGNPSLNAQLLRVFQTIPPEATVYTAHRYSAYLSNRDNLVVGDLSEPDLNFEAMMDGRFDETGIRPEQISYIVCDLITDQCGWRLATEITPESRQREANVNRLIQSGQWQVYWKGENVAILQRTRS